MNLTEMTSPETDQTNYLEAYVGEGKKYKDTQELAKAYANADLHIKELKDKLDELNAGSQTLNEVLAELRKPKAETAQVPTSEVNVAEVVQSELTKAQEKARREANVNTSLKQLAEHYGSEADALRAVKKFIGNDRELKETVDDLSAKRPDLLFNLITKQVEKAQDNQNLPGIDKGQPGSSVPSVGLTWTQARELKKKDPKAYNDPAFRKRMEAEVAKYVSQGKDWFAT